MTKKQKEQRAALNGTILIVIIAVIVASSIVNTISPRTSVIVQSAPVAAEASKNAVKSDLKPIVVYTKHYQINYVDTGSQLIIQDIRADDTLVRDMNLACDGSTSNDEGQNCIIQGINEIKSFFKTLNDLANSNT